MDRWKQLISAAKLQSIADSMRRPEHGEDGLDPGFHPDDVGATDDLQQAAAYGDHGASGEEDEEKGNASTLREVQDQEAADIIRTFGLHSKPHTDGLSTGATTPDGGGTTAATTPDGLGGGEGEPASAPVNAGLLSTLLRLSQLERTSKNIINKEYFLNKEVLDEDAARDKRTKWYQDPDMKKSTSSLPRLSALAPPTAEQRRLKRQRRRQQKKLTVHVASVLARQRYIMQLCRALMAYGAPTHRLEQYMVMTAGILDVSAQFLYMPGCMVMSFDDRETHTAQVKLVRAVQGMDLSRLTEVHNIYKSVVHDRTGADEAAEELGRIMRRGPRYNKPFVVLLYGLSSACIGPWAFGARPIDLPVIFVLGAFVGFMQHVVAPYSILFANVFEVAMAIITSFIARGIGSIRATGPFADLADRKYVFCFSAIAQSSICMILPGFSVLCSSLELQSHQIIPGSVRLVYTILYSLFLGYGVTIGTTAYGLIDKGATGEGSCVGEPQQPYGNAYVQHFPFVAVYCILAGLVNQARFRQTPIMAVFGLIGYMPNYFLSNRLGSSTGLANTVGAFALGTAGNLYSRLWHGHAASAIIPGIFTIVSSGLAASGAIISGLQYSKQIQDGTINDATVVNSNNSLTGLGYGMIEVAIGVSVGLFISAVVVYPYGKQRSGLFSF
ncbi:hypothetical protein V2A60_004158 [Cordyceps javanica]|uniref:DUF1212 domain membrane protein n=1 Tax=Cordyceps javanica TaxID=43265 RepID=A0A545VKR1_9HYPO|nr:DUF1212 domain membrane protein [Cordyceps javanica]TQW02317.1 DUF1212 domain membrane protein [Cordyceps javanica]